METVYLPEREMLPRILVARLYDTSAAGRTSPTRTRRVEDYELSFCLEGGGAVLTENLRWELKPGDVRFSWPGQQISSEPPYRCYTLYFRLGPQGVLYRNELLDAISAIFSGELDQSALFARIVQLFDAGEPGCAAMGNGLLLELLAGYCRRFCSEGRCRPAVGACIAYMRTHLKERVSLEVLGQLTGYAPLHIQRLFRGDTGLTPHEYLGALGMAETRRMLAESSIPISRLCADCGFASASYFHTLFQKVNSISPGEYRRRAGMV